MRKAGLCPAFLYGEGLLAGLPDLARCLTMQAVKIGIAASISDCGGFRLEAIRENAADRS
jgi:hypothetical protein